MRVAFVSEVPAGDVGGFSGTPYYMSAAIRESVSCFEYIQVPGVDWGLALTRDSLAQQQIAASGRYLTARLRHSNADVVVCSGGAAISRVETPKPVVLWHDSTWFTQSRLGLDEFRTRHPRLYESDCRMLNNVSLIVFAADWVRDVAGLAYDLPPDKVHVVPFGANIRDPGEALVQNAVLNRPIDTCRLTFVAIDWRKKRLPVAYEVVKATRREGVQAELTAIGCEVERPRITEYLKSWATRTRRTGLLQFQIDFNHDPSVRSTGRLLKSDQEQYRRLCSILEGTHFLLHPAEFEAFGLAPIEANAYAVPVLTTDCCGMRTTIRNGVNGYRFSSSEFVDRSVEVILQRLNDPNLYREMARASYREFKDRLNWATNWQRVAKIIEARFGVSNP